MGEVPLYVFQRLGLTLIFSEIDNLLSRVEGLGFGGVRGWELVFRVRGLEV